MRGGIVFAQSLLEYAAVSSWVEAMDALGSATRDALSEVPRASWLALGATVVAVVALVNRRAGRTKW